MREPPKKTQLPPFDGDPPVRTGRNDLQSLQELQRSLPDLPLPKSFAAQAGRPPEAVAKLLDNYCRRDPSRTALQAKAKEVQAESERWLERRGAMLTKQLQRVASLKDPLAVVKSYRARPSDFGDGQTWRTVGAAFLLCLIVIAVVIEAAHLAAIAGASGARWVTVHPAMPWFVTFGILFSFSLTPSFLVTYFQERNSSSSFPRWTYSGAGVACVVGVASFCLYYGKLASRTSIWESPPATIDGSLQVFLAIISLGGGVVIAKSMLHTLRSERHFVSLTEEERAAELQHAESELEAMESQESEATALLSQSQSAFEQLDADREVYIAEGMGIFQKLEAKRIREENEREQRESERKTYDDLIQQQHQLDSQLKHHRYRNGNHSQNGDSHHA